jgi:Heterokaryon incompatibility protein (HET)
MSHTKHPYYYQPLLPGPYSIRLLRLLPHEDENAPIKCQLVNYSLENSGNQEHLYDALSYVWGDPDNAQTVSIDGCVMHITPNLHAALLRLRNRHFERLIWADAVCINQEDFQEKERQIWIMAKIFGQARGVIVWLGPSTGDSDRALETINIAGHRGAAPLSKDKRTDPRSIESDDKSNDQSIHENDEQGVDESNDQSDDEIDDQSIDENDEQAIIALLQRAWFRRIWVRRKILGKIYHNR